MWLHQLTVLFFLFSIKSIFDHKKKELHCGYVVPLLERANYNWLLQTGNCIVIKL